MVQARDGLIGDQIKRVVGEAAYLFSTNCQRGIEIDGPGAYPAVIGEDVVVVAEGVAWNSSSASSLHKVQGKDIPSPLLFPLLFPFPEAFPESPFPAELLLPSLFPLFEGEPQILVLDPGSRGTVTSSIIFPTYVPRVSDRIFLTFLPIDRPEFPEKISLPLPNWFLLPLEAC